METLEELLKQKEEIEEKISEIKEKEYQDKVQKSVAFRKTITPEIKTWLLNNTHHCCSSCNGHYNPNNSFRNVQKKGKGICGNYNCPKCALIEYLDDNFDYLATEYEMKIDVYFCKISKE